MLHAPQTQRVINIIDTADTSPILLAIPASPISIQMQSTMPVMERRPTIPNRPAIQAIFRSCALPRRPPPTDFLLLLALKERLLPPATIFVPLPSCPPLSESFRCQVAKFRGNCMAAVETVARPCILEYRFDIIDMLCDVIRIRQHTIQNNAAVAHTDARNNVVSLLPHAHIS